jgi:dTDP-4-dehydrorhamnose reductase
MRILILGNKGMLGRDMETEFHGEDFIGLDKDDLDITEREAVFETFTNIQPDVVINCTGYTNVDKAEDEEDLANQINGYGVGILASACREFDATLVHFSTDYVFNGEKNTGYSEDEAPSPLNAYGRSKALGESLLHDEMEMLDEINPIEGRYFLIRTSWLYGKHGKNFVETMLELGQSRKELKVVDDQFGKPTFTVDLCKQVKWLVTSLEYPSGIYHITNEDTSSWHEFANEIFSLTDVAVNVVACSSEEFPRPAKRPKYSALLNNKLPPLRSWKEALKDYITNYR